MCNGRIIIKRLSRNMNEAVDRINLAENRV
jgi:hypothetical protein